VIFKPQEREINVSYGWKREEEELFVARRQIRMRCDAIRWYEVEVSLQYSLLSLVMCAIGLLDRHRHICQRVIPMLTPLRVWRCFLFIFLATAVKYYFSIPSIHVPPLQSGIPFPYLTWELSAQLKAPMFTARNIVAHRLERTTCVHIVCFPRSPGRYDSCATKHCRTRPFCRLLL
jgi:hypothetical protein